MMTGKRCMAITVTLTVCVWSFVAAHAPIDAAGAASRETFFTELDDMKKLLPKGTSADHNGPWTGPHLIKTTDT